MEIKKTISLVLSRDEARAVQEQFFPYLQMLCEMNIRDAGQLRPQIWQAKALRSMFLQIKLVFERKLSRPGNMITLPLSFAHALLLKSSLDELPINSQSDYLINLRQHISAFIQEKMESNDY